MIAILIYEGFGFTDVWARVDLSMVGPPEIESADRTESVDFLAGERSVYKTGVKLPRGVTIEIPQPALDGEVKFGRVLGEQTEHPTAHRNIASLLMDAVLNGRTAEFVFYRKGDDRGVATQGIISGPDAILLFGDFDVTEDNREPGGQVPPSVEITLEPVAWGVCQSVEGGVNYWLAGSPLIDPDATSG